MKTRLAVAAFASLALVACGSADPAAGPLPTATVTVTVTATPDVVEGEPEQEETAETAAPEEPASGVAAFGESVTLPDKQGTIMITAPEPFSPSDTAFLDGEWDEFVSMTVTETNDGAEPVMAGWVVTATTGDKAAEQVFDSAQEIGSPTVDVMPGKTITYKIAFGRTKGAEFVLSAGPLAGWDKVYYQ